MSRDSELKSDGMAQLIQKEDFGPMRDEGRTEREDVELEAGKADVIGSAIARDFCKLRQGVLHAG